MSFRERFNSNEEPEDIYCHPIFLEGSRAREGGKTLQDNPYSWNISTSFIDFRKKGLWNAGWCDADQVIISEQEARK